MSKHCQPQRLECNINVTFTNIETGNLKTIFSFGIVTQIRIGARMCRKNATTVFTALKNMTQVILMAQKLHIRN